MEVTLIVGAGLGLALALGAEFVVKVLSGGKGPAVTVLQIESVAILTQFVGASWQYGLLALYRHRALLITSAMGLLASVLLSVALIPALDARGAAIAFSGAEVLVALMCLLFLRAARPDMSFSPRVPVRVLAATLLGLSVALVPGLGSLPQALLGVTVYGVVLLLAGAIPRELFQALPGRAPAQP